jgi:hypothetical protein
MEQGGVMSESLVATARSLRAALADFDPTLLSGSDCATLVEELARTEKACGGARARAAARAAECGAHGQAGHSDATEWLARAAGSSPGTARSELETAKALESCPDTKAALAAGELSLAQAGEITRTEAEAPGSEAGLLEVARTSSLGELRDRSRERRLSAIAPEDLHRRQRAAHRFRHWRNGLGMVCISGELVPEAGIALVNRVDAEAGRVRRAARAEGRDEPYGAHAADALAALVAGGGRSGASRTDLVVVADLGAYRRGHVHDGEACHLVGGGPIPVSLAHELGADAFVKAVLHDGVAIHTVAHFGRHLPAELRTALEVGAPPGFDGVSCVEEGCDRRYGLEWDHVDPVANGGATSYANLKARCWDHHRDKTERDRLAGLLSGRGEGCDPP